MTNIKEQKSFIIWDNHDGNALIMENHGFDTLYLKMNSPILNGGYPDKFFQVKPSTNSFTYDAGNSKLIASFENPHNPIITYDKNILYHDGNIYKDGFSICLVIKNEFPIIFHTWNIINTLPDDLVPMPEIRVLKHLLYNGNKYIYISYSKYTQGMYKCFIGPPDEMKEVKIIKIDSYRDGGTTIIKTDFGSIYIPTRYKKGTKDYKFRFNNIIFEECKSNLTVIEQTDTAKVIGNVK